jgi:hypothetical protein
MEKLIAGMEDYPSPSGDSIRRAREAIALKAFPMMYDLNHITLPQIRELVMKVADNLKSTLSEEAWVAEQHTIACENFTTLRTYHLGELQRQLRENAITIGTEMYESIVADDISLYTTYKTCENKDDENALHAWAVKLSCLYLLPCKPTIIP